MFTHKNNESSESEESEIIEETSESEDESSKESKELKESKEYKKCSHTKEEHESFQYYENVYIINIRDVKTYKRDDSDIKKYEGKNEHVLNYIKIVKSMSILLKTLILERYLFSYESDCEFTIKQIHPHSLHPTYWKIKDKNERKKLLLDDFEKLKDECLEGIDCEYYSFLLGKIYHSQNKLDYNFDNYKIIKKYWEMGKEKNHIGSLNSLAKLFFYYDSKNNHAKIIPYCKLGFKLGSNESMTILGDFYRDIEYDNSMAIKYYRMADNYDRIVELDPDGDKENVVDLEEIIEDLRKENRILKEKLEKIESLNFIPMNNLSSFVANAIKNNDIKSLKEIIPEFKTKIDMIIENKRPALFLAISCGNTEIAKLLIDNEADVNNVDYIAHTPLNFACKYYNDHVVDLNMIKMLLENKANPNIGYDENGSVLFSACIENKTELIKLLLKYKANPKIANFRLFTPMHHACLHNNKEIISLLLKKNINIDAKDIMKEITPLMILCENNKVETAKLLIDHKADINARNSNGDTPLLLSSYNFQNNSKTINMLIENKADVNIKNYYKESSLHIILDKGYQNDYYVSNNQNKLDILRLLIENKIDLNSKNSYGFSPLHLACKCDDDSNDDLDIVKLLVESKACLDDVSTYIKDKSCKSESIKKYLRNRKNEESILPVLCNVSEFWGKNFYI